MSAKGYKFYTYIHVRNDIGEVFYVGKGTGRRAFALGRNPYWDNIVAKYGHTVHIVAYFTDENDAFEHEKEMITELRAAGFNLANMTDGGEGASNPSAETRAKLSAAHKGHNISDETRDKLSKILSNPSDETRAKLSAAGRGRIPSAETRAKIGVRNHERVFSAETRAKISMARTGHTASDETRAKLSVVGKGRITSDETRAKLSVVGKGHKRGLGRVHS